MRDEGDHETAERVASLKRPTIPVWAINQLARRHPEDIADLIEVHRSLAEVRDPAGLRDLSRRRRQLVGALTDRARELLVDADHAASRQTMDRISTTLLAADSPEEEDLLKRGRLERELTPTGFQEAFMDVPAFEGSGDVALTDAQERAEKEAQQLAAELREAQDQAKGLERHAARLRREADALESEARTWRRRAGQLEKKEKAARDRTRRR